MRVENSFEEWGVRVGNSKIIRGIGRGFYGKRHAEQERERILHNAKLPMVGQPRTAVVVRRQVVEIRETTEWVEDE